MQNKITTPGFDLPRLKVACKDCTLFQLCLPVGMDEPDLELLESIIKRRRPLQRGDYLFRLGEDFRSIYQDLYAVRRWQ